MDTRQPTGYRFSRHELSIFSFSSLSIWLSLFAGYRHGVIATPIALVVQKSFRSTGDVYLT